MLPPDSRTTLLKNLLAPPGHTLEHLVATTFTLDLESALLPCLALGGSSNVDGADTVETIAAIQASIANIDIFHQAGVIAVPRDRGPLFSLLEDSLHAVVPRRGLFHPKVWVGLYRNSSGNELVKLLVLSRNLTKDRSWDVALCLDGEIVGSPRAQNKPIVDLLRYLTTASMTSLDERRTERLDILAQTLRYAQWELPPDTTDLQFHVYGIPGRPQPKPDFSGYTHLLVSPFLQDAGLEHLAEQCRDTLTVVSRQESLDGLSPEFATWIDRPFVLSPTAGIPAEDDENSRHGTLFTGLHAKLYVVERAKMAHLFVGSANATRAAFHDNVEVLVELTGRVKTYGAEAALGGSGFGSILDAYEITPGAVVEDDPRAALDGYLRAIACIPLDARLSLDEHDRAELNVTSSDVPPTPPPGGHVTLSLLTDPSTATRQTGFGIDVTFTDVALIDVTSLLVITVDDGHGLQRATVVKAELIGDVPRRRDGIITGQITSPDAFRRLLALLLAFGAPAEDADITGTDDSTAGSRWAALEQGLFEQMLKATVARPEVLTQLGGVVTAIITDGDPHQVLPEGFTQLWSAIADATATSTATDVEGANHV